MKQFIAAFHYAVLIGLYHLDSVFEFYASDHLCQVIKSAQLAPVFFRTLTQLEHPVAGQASFSTLG